MTPPLGSSRLLACPGCSPGPLEATDGGLRCPTCQVVYPSLDGIPCLVSDPELWQATWRGRLDAYASTLQSRVADLHQEAELSHLLPSTRQRVLRLAEALAHERIRILDFRRLLEPPCRAGNPIPPMHGADVDTRAVVECDENVFRDWVWGKSEVDDTRTFAERLFPERPETLALYGVGAARLAVDMHRSLRPTETYAFDHNPLPLWAAWRLLRGETLEIHELPLSPSRAEDVAVLRRIAYSEPVPPGFHLLFADAAEPPFAPGSLDAVVTAWFIDAAHMDFRDLAPRINRVLRPGGHLVNVGPLRFKDAVSHSYSIEEVHEIVELSGFRLLSREQADLPYFVSPVSGTRALETVFGFAAEKIAEAAPAHAQDLVTPWLTYENLPVLPTPAMSRLQHLSMVAVAVLSLVDGARSINDISQALASAWQADPARVKAEVRAFFTQIEPD